VIVVAVIAFVVWLIFGSLAYAIVAAVSVSDHRMSMCARTGDPDVDHGRHRPRSEERSTDQESRALEILEKVNVIVVDKTGTLTEGKPTVQTVKALPAEVRTGSGSDRGSSSPLDGSIGAVTENRILQLAASLEQHSEHPLASAIVDEARKAQALCSSR
jgi:magnesium-transporting ATPase (P-type)